LVRPRIPRKRQRALELLSRSKPELQARFGVTGLALFGSIARDTSTSVSDVDVLVAFDGPATSKRYFGVQFYLEDLLGCPVDLVTEKVLSYTEGLDQERKRSNHETAECKIVEHAGHAGFVQTATATGSDC